MADHLPECPCHGLAYIDAPPTYKMPSCICPALRACEQRVRQEEALKHLQWMREDDERDEVMFQRGVQAARDAVAEVEHIGYYAEEVRDAALAAIDQLITKNSGENYE